MPPTVSIVMPTYNRAGFLPQALRSIAAQRWQDWELIVIDDGSSDDTRAVLDGLRATVSQPVHYHYQQNQGPPAARNAGVDRARGDYVAFFDSDDEWLPHHLTDCVAALEANRDVDWVYGAGRRIRHATGEVLVPHSFYPGGRPLPFLSLRTRQAGALRVLDDPDAVRCQLLSGLFCGFQGSVLRRSIFGHLRIPLFRLGDDRAFPMMALKAGHRLGYFDDVHVVYHVHDAGISTSSASASVEKRVGVHRELINCYEQLENLFPLSRPERRALKVALNEEYFWNMGYAALWQHGRRREALGMFWKGLRLRPLDLRCWKTYLLALARTLLRPDPEEAPTGPNQEALA